jgi:retron-type reverse transcriptase
VIDIRKFFDGVPWDLTLKAVTRHTDLRWVLLYVERWLKAPQQAAPTVHPLAPDPHVPGLIRRAR